MLVRIQNLPSHIRYGMFRWIEYGNVPGDFLCMVILNNLTGAFQKADNTNRDKMFEIASFMYSDAPSQCRGSQKMMDEWCESGGAKGRKLPIEYQGVESEWFNKEDRT